MDDLARWLGEQFDEDERPATDARADGDGRWTYVETKGGDHKVVDSLGYTITGHYDIDAQPYFCEPHIAEWDPARVLREIEAKRKLLADHPIVPRDIEPTVIDGEEIGGPYYPFGCANCHAEPDSPEVNGLGYCFTWKTIASVYAHRPGYQEGWAP